MCAYSAGSQPTGKVHPQSIKLLGAKGYATADARSQSWDDFAHDDAPRMDVVITVCASAAGETCPIWPAKAGQSPVRAHWGVDDPAAAPQSAQPTAFEAAYATLHNRAAHFLAHLPPSHDRTALKAALMAAGDIA